MALLVAATVFALQNLKGVDVTFLSFHGQLPLAVLLLVVAVLGSLAVFAFGAARVLQLRLHTRRLGRELSKRGD
ncbi:MAG TPA: lipopolysaccharide assembly protein LapA domain-containing protein [Actinomycetota bacterium]|nr:lipopolysaccharide assembly protein LapA domain-containing protein [Actinomycetota bacterium]